MPKWPVNQQTVHVGTTCYFSYLEMTRAGRSKTLPYEQADDASATNLSITTTRAEGQVSVGNSLDFSRGDWLGFFTRCVREHGDVVFLRFLNASVCLLTHPDDIEHVLVKSASNFVKSRNYYVLKPVLGNGLLISEGTSWRKTANIGSALVSS